MVITREIPRGRWRQVLDDLSRVHAGAAVLLEVLDEEGGLQTHGPGFRLVGLTADGEPGAESIAVIIDGRTRLTHLIAHPCSLTIEQLWESRTAHLQVADASGARTLISLGAPIVAGGRPRSRRRGAVALVRLGPPASLP